MLRLGRQDIDIAAGRRDYVNADTYTLPVDVDALAVQPHAHFLAKEARAWATLPGGAVVPLIYIKDWNFHWQDVYTYAQPLALPKGTVIEMRYTYDNSAANRANPNRPPRRVTFGQTSASEMGSLWLQVVPRRPADLARLEQDFGPKILRDDIAGNEKWLEVEPRNAQLRAELAACYLEANRPADALTQLNEAVRLDPDSRPPLRRRTRAADPAGLRRRRSVVSEGARAEARVCRGALRPRRRQTRAAQSGRRDRVVREGAGRRPVERLRSLQPRAGAGRARTARSRDPELSQSDRACAGRRRRASEPGARARHAESARRSDLSLPPHARNRARSRRCAAGSGVDYRDRAECGAAGAGRRGASRRARRPPHQRHERDSARHAGGRLCRSRPDRSRGRDGGECAEDCDGNRRAGARRRDSRAARTLPREVDEPT